MSQQFPVAFSLTLNGQEMIVTFSQPSYCVRAGYGHLEFSSPHRPRRRIPVSETGYKSHFFPLCDLDAFSGMEDYALNVAKAFLYGESGPEQEEEKSQQLSFF